MEALLQPAPSELVALAYTEEKREHFYTNAMRRYERAPHLFIGFPSRYLPNVRPHYIAPLKELCNRKFKSRFFAQSEGNFSARTVGHQ